LKPVYLPSAGGSILAFYWDIGRMIVNRQVDDSWSKFVVEYLVADLQAEFPGVGGLSASNLWRMKDFF